MDPLASQVARSVFVRHAQVEGRPAEFELLGLRWELLPGVFAPVYTASTELYSRWLPYPVGGSFLEVGCGAGVTAVVAALRGCRSVTALDIAAAAVANTRRNALRHGVADRVHVMQSDLFAGLCAGARFDLIFWNSNYAEAPADFRYETDLQRAFFDAGYGNHRTYLTEGRRHLAPGGRLLLGFGSVGNRALLADLAARAGLRVQLLRSASSDVAARLDHQLLELVPPAHA
jgi:release factor glutamine methyltransferase